MNTAELQFRAQGGAPTQEDKILDCLQANLGEWVGVPQLYNASGSYVIHSRIAGLRKKGANILNRTERINGQTHSFYKLIAP